MSKSIVFICNSLNVTKTLYDTKCTQKVMNHKVLLSAYLPYHFGSTVCRTLNSITYPSEP